MLARTDDYPGWFPWLDGFRADGLHEGATAVLVVRPPLPYRLHLRLELTEVVPARLVAATVSGDLEGTARLELADADGPAGDHGTEARLAWSLRLRRPLLVAAARVARPAMVWGHDWVVDVGVRHFHRRALGGDRSDG